MDKWPTRKIIMGKIDYKSAGVAIDAGNEAVNRLTSGVKSTFTSNVLAGI